MTFMIFNFYSVSYLKLYLLQILKMAIYIPRCLVVIPIELHSVKL